ncbi:chromosome partitioning protein ParB [Pluralibacter gergoviae]
MANSFKQMFKSGQIKRPDGRMLINIDDIHIVDGFNPRDYNSEECKAADEDLFQHLKSGGSVPPIEVKALDSGGVWIVEGHRRYRAFLRCREAGVPVEWITIAQFKGSDLEAQAHVMRSSRQLKLSPIEKAANLKKMAAFNISNSEIAELVGLSVATVEKLLALSVTDHAVQQTVKNGEVSVDVALQRVEEFGSKAAEKLEEDKAKAAAAGKKKVTRSLIAPEISVKKARRLVELMAMANITDEGVMTLDGIAMAEALEIIDEQKRIADNRSKAAA